MIVVNDTWRLAPSADVLYACDLKWWNWHVDKITFEGPWVSGDMEAADVHGLHWMPGRHELGFSRDPEVIHFGFNGGFQAANLALLAGADPIILIGMDNQEGSEKPHFFGNHPDNSRPPYDMTLRHWRIVAEQLALDGHPHVINASLASSIDCFDRASVEEILP